MNKIYTVTIDNNDTLYFSSFDKALQYVAFKGFDTKSSNQEKMDQLIKQNERMVFCEHIPAAFAAMLTITHTCAYIGTINITA